MRKLTLRSALPLFVLTGLCAAGVAYLTAWRSLAQPILFTTLVCGSLPLAWEVFQSLLQRRFGVDLIAIVAIVASLPLEQYLAGTVILLMLSGGEALEGYALRRARKELTDLINNAPRVAHRLSGSAVVDVPAEWVRPGDMVLVKPGESLPVDGVVAEGVAMVDESALTGESLPIRKITGTAVMSGSTAKDGVLTIQALKSSAESKYQQIIRLVQAAEEQRAPFVRLADRYSVWFTALAFALAIAAWSISGDPVRALAVLVVATPCPLILATPIAFASGISRAAKRGIIVRTGGALEQLGEARCFVFDKTGTLTLGAPTVQHAEGFGREAAEVLRLAASLDQLSTHVLARSLSAYAQKQALTLMVPEQFRESLGDGVTGTLAGEPYVLGRLPFLEASAIAVSDTVRSRYEDARAHGQIAICLGNLREKKVVGIICFADAIRPNVRQLFTNLSRLGIRRVLMLTGDKRQTAMTVAAAIGLAPENIRAECLPEQKVQEVRKLQQTDAPVVMVGDGVNDAPALAAADVGIAMGGHGSTASSEAGDIVILIDRIERVGDALLIGHNVLSIAKQSIFVGIGLSTVLMFAAAGGFIRPVAGALLQEIIDVVVILNALRVLLMRSTLEEKDR